MAVIAPVMKLSGASSATRVSTERANMSSARIAMAWPAMVPLGAPVEPEVKNTNAGAVGSSSRCGSESSAL